MKATALLTGNRVRNTWPGMLLGLILTPSILLCQGNVRYEIDGSSDLTTNVLSATVTLSGFERATRHGSLRQRYLINGEPSFPGVVDEYGSYTVSFDLHIVRIPGHVPFAKRETRFN